MRLPHPPVPLLLVTLLVAAASLAGCGEGDAPQVDASRQTDASIDSSAAPSTPATPVEVTGSSEVAGPVGSASTPAPPAPDAPTTSTTLVGPDLPTTTVAGRRLYQVTGQIGVFPVSGTLCAFDQPGATGTVGAPAGSTVEQPDVGTISYGGEVTFAATAKAEGTYQYSITAYSTSFTGNGTYRISWIDGGRSGLMDLYESSAKAENEVVDEDDTQDQETAMSLVAIGAC